MSIEQLPTYFLSHGGGPWSYVEEPRRKNYVNLERFLVELRPEMRSPVRAVLIISGHWEERGFAISSAAQPGMVFDYSGFPDYLYHIRYAAPGSPEIAARVLRLLAAGGMAARLDGERGYDHGTFSLMKVLAPDENVPIVQLSIDVSMDPALHVQVGRLLAPLRREGVLIIGSGFSYHNFAIRDARAAPISQHFDAWLQHVLVQTEPAERTERLIRWEDAPYARDAHAREEHLIPLMVAVGAAEDEPGACVYHETAFLQFVTASSFRFGSPRTGAAM
ncbi:DODA-type extradiol aromatic ring-opening family dioxygenase [Paraburkholderia fynbosensis]|uniref:4,5-DOPA dioxygenase extradiol n=1 Tax=Paraburkholderia fynbosensis TaxID=1200993 RepID=A0A6J5H1J3_9BURK|nr:class III extradiol ring-cleavage dioxygenase [Paraburkholderia fynbosensis]CAB3810783.1 4,5-DOPA dioxygenase extradiol [Paraburkholderia fynbosensis]